MNLCHNEAIWDPGQLWSSPVPVFNRCFQHTVLIWIPAMILWTLVPIQLCFTMKFRRKDRSIGRNLFNRSKALLTFLIALLSLAQFGYDLWNYLASGKDSAVSLAELSGLLLNVFTFTLFGFLLHLHRIHGVHTSGLAWFFTFFSTLCSLPTLYMYLQFGESLSGYHDQLELIVVALRLAFTATLFLLTCFADQRPPAQPPTAATEMDICRPLLKKSISIQGHKKPAPAECPAQRASFLSLITFWWVNGLMLTGYRKALKLPDLWPLNPEDTTKTIAPNFDRNWSRSSRNDKVVGDQQSYGTFESTETNFASDLSAKKEPGIASTLFLTFKGEIFSCGVSELLLSIVQFVNPQLLKVFLGFIAASSLAEPQWHGYLLAALFFISALVISFARTYIANVEFSLFQKIRTALISAIYRKSLTLSNASRNETTTGAIVNLMSTDVDHVAQATIEVNMAWSAPLVLGLAIYFLWIELGYAVFAGIAVLVIIIPINAFITSFQNRYQTKQMEAKDERVKVITEVLTGIKVIKLYAWEVPFIKRISAIREREVRQIRNVAYLNAGSSITWTLAPFLVSLISFGTFVLVDEKNILTPQKAFTALVLFESLRFPMTAIPELITNLVMAYVSMRRLNRFLNSEQLQKYVTREEATEAVTIENGTFAWSAQKAASETEAPSEGNQFKTVLKDINLAIPKGSLVAVVGHVGAGKSSLISAILGDMERVEGSVNVAKGESVAYVAQQAWIRNAMLRDNVLFGSKFDKKRYEAILEMCALKPDLAILPGGDQTEIGEKGINLSGGQKQRVALARACYSNASLFLLDDSLSAVDSHVAQHIFQHVLSNTSGCLKDRTRILVTNNIAILPEVDHIVVLSNGAISEAGTYKQLLANSGKFAEFIHEHVNEKKYEQQQSQDDSRPVYSRSTSRQMSVETPQTPGTPILDKPPFDAQLVEEEHTETGQVKFSIYLTYFHSWTRPFLIATLLGYLATQGTILGSDIWLALWSNDALITTANGTIMVDVEQRNYRLAGYALIALAQALFFFIGALSLAKSNVNSSRQLHRSLLERIMKSPMHFFDTQPLGRIVNRFSRDIDTVDSSLSQIFESFYTNLLNLISNIALICFKIPVFIAVVLPVSVVYFYIQKFYIATYRQLKRLESVNKSPIFSFFSETLNGVATIRAFGHSQRFVDESNKRVDTMQQCFYPLWIINRWLSLRLEFLGNLIVLAVALFAVIYRDSFRSEPGFIGLVLTYALVTTESLNIIVRRISDMENGMVPVERINEWCHNETEREWTRFVNDNPKVPDDWPSKGEIAFAEYSVRYRSGLDLVLRNVNAAIGPGEKIGLAGRTGAGKSSFTLALFRILEADKGRIEIDGINIAWLGLHELRQKLAIIPQDPVLFSGTIRTNLDPFNHYTDDQLWQALEHSHLKEYIASQGQGLDYRVAENGENLSVGQRQLICLGRALLRRAKILVLDEATGSIDLETDALIQETIRREFKHCTVLTIAHRLHTIIDSDRVMVLDSGKVAEFDKPSNLLKNRKSKFYALAKDANLV